MDTSDYNVAAGIAANMADEAEAIQGYLELMKIIIDPEDKKILAEIISDEKNHAHLLRDMSLKYDGNIKEAED